MSRVNVKVAQATGRNQNGEVRFSGLPEDLLASPELKRAYLGL
jgi:hypothetical protein